MSTRSVPIAVMLVATSGCAALEDRWGGGTMRGPGALYESYLAGSATTLVVELDHEPGALWDTSTDADEQFVQQLERITAKDVKIRPSEDLPKQGSSHTYSVQELERLHTRHQDLNRTQDRVVMHALFLNGDSVSQDGQAKGDVAGLAFEAQGFAVFEGAIEKRSCDNDAQVCGGRDGQQAQAGVKQWQMMRSVAIHEAGHLLGLVNSPLPMVVDHEMETDPKPGTEANEGKAHSANESSVMVWRVENAEEIDEPMEATLLMDGAEIPWRFGEHDVQDARALREPGG